MGGPLLGALLSWLQTAAPSSDMACRGRRPAHVHVSRSPCRPCHNIRGGVVGSVLCSAEVLAPTVISGCAGRLRVRVSRAVSALLTPSRRPIARGRARERVGRCRMAPSVSSWALPHPAQRHGRGMPPLLFRVAAQLRCARSACPARFPIRAYSAHGAKHFSGTGLCPSSARRCCCCPGSAERVRMCAGPGRRPACVLSRASAGRGHK